MRNRLMIVLFVLLLSLPGVVSADDLQNIKSRGEVSFAMSGQYPPFNFVDERNQLNGFDVEICSTIANRMSVEAKPLSTAWDGIIAGLLTNRFDLICGSMAITQERLNSIDFSDPYYRSGAQLFVRKGSSLAGTDDLDNKKIGVTLGTTYEEWVRTNLPGADVRTYKGVPDMV
ncbi:MAG TPA: transporter substrate-binding domain-containing protein, partial [Pelovirga sp.]|nr:transporter substrate-binding domain-containing protein [Pelovirga sp.]